jgi:hypothetical protein
MWIFTKYGFYSAVCARQGTGGHGQAVDRERMMVRGRLRSHLQALKDRFPEFLGPCDIYESAGVDYAVRLFVPKTTWQRVLAALADEADYDNFKEEVKRHQGAAGTAYQKALEQVWSVMRKLQK